MVQPDGKIVTAGFANTESTDSDFLLARTNPGGALDPTFGIGGKVRTSFGDLNGGANGAALQPDGRIVAVGFQATFTDEFAQFALARYANAEVLELPGCSGNPAALMGLAADAPIGGTFSVSLSSPDLATGLGVLFLGADGTDASGCGIVAPGIGELLLALAPMPHQVGSGSLSGGALGFALPVPDQPALVGAQVGLQGAVVGLSDPGLPIELSHALVVTIGP
jgi:uncharacterized delta-60 repeat protein